MLTQSEQTKLVKKVYESLYEKLEQENSWELWTLEDVPEEMRAEPISKNGRYKWKLTPTHITQDDFQALEQRLGCALPSLVKTFLSTYYNLFIDAGGYIGLYSTPDNPFRTLPEYVNPAMTAAGLLPILTSASDDYVYCIDLANMPDEDACPAYAIEIDEYLNYNEETDREEFLSSTAEFAAANFQAFLEECIEIHLR